jgi:hypothetical protein
MVEVQQVAAAIILLPPGLFWLLFLIRSNRQRPFHLSWFRGKLVLGHALAALMISLVTLFPDPPILIANALLIIYISLKAFYPMYHVLLSDAEYAITVGHLLREKKKAQERLASSSDIRPK